MNDVKMRELELDEMSTMGAGSIEGTAGKVGGGRDDDDDYLREMIDELQDEVLVDYVNEQREEIYLREYIDKILLEKQKDQEFSKYFGINVLNHEVLTQIKDDIHTKTMSLGDDETFVEYFKRYMFLYVKDLIETDLDIVEIENEIDQIKNVLNEKLINEMSTMGAGVDRDWETYIS